MNVEVIKGNKNAARTRNSTGATLDRLRVAAYVRVSTDDEDQIHSFNSQREHYAEYIKGQAQWVFTDIYADEAITGTKADKREGFKRLINDCLDGKIDLVITKSISRFARNTIDTLHYVRMLKDRGIAVLFEEENIDTLTMDGELLLTILSSVAQQEVENTSAHVKKGLRMKMQRGELCGYQGCLGYDYDTETKSISINEEEAHIVRYVFMRYNSGVGSSVIARELTEQGYPTPRGLQVWGDSTVRGIITNEKYKGDLRQGKTYTVDPISKRRIENRGEEDQFYLTGHHEAIISAEDFEKAQQILAKRSHSRLQGGKRERYSRKYTFSSRLECGFCGGVLSRRSWNSGTEFQKEIWQCSVATKHGRTKCPNSKGIPESIIESAFVEAYNLVAGDNSDILDEFLKRMEDTIDVDGKKKELTAQKKALRDRESKKAKLLDLHLSGVLEKEAFTEKYQSICAEEAEIQNHIAELTNAMESGISTSARIAEFRRVLGANKTIEKFDSVVFEAVIDRVIVGQLNDDGSPDPYYLTFVFRNGSQHEMKADGVQKKGRKKNVPIPYTTHVETVCLLVRRNGLHINIDVDVEEMLQDKRGQATYPQIKEYVLEQTGMKVSSLYISQVKRKCGLDVSDSYNKPKSEVAHVPQCPPEKEKAIMDALAHFGLIN